MSTSMRCRTRYRTRSDSARTATHASYDPENARRLWRVLLQTERVFAEFRTAFLGKCSPVHFFWRSFDLAVTRFSGRRAPPSGACPTARSVAHEAYSHEVCSAGFWPGDEPAGTGLLLLRLAGAAGLLRGAGRPAMRSRATSSANTICPTTRCAPPPIPTPPSWNS